jgi:hypothetical protein
MTWSQLDASAKAPWTSTMVGRMSAPSVVVGTSVTVALSARPPPVYEALVRALDRHRCLLGVRERRGEFLT